MKTDELSRLIERAKRDVRHRHSGSDWSFNEMEITFKTESGTIATWRLDELSNNPIVDLETQRSESR